MALSEELKAIVESILAGTESEEEISVLQKARESGEEITFQVGNYVVNIGGQAKDFQIGNRIYHGATLTEIREAIREELKEFRPEYTASIISEATSILDSDWLMTHLEMVENEFVDYMCSIEEAPAAYATDCYVELLVQERKKIENKEQGKTEHKEGMLSEFLSGSSCRLLVFGEGGSGKTTLLLKLAADAAVEAKRNSNSPIPFYIKLNFFDTCEESFEQLLRMLGEVTNLSGEKVKILWQQGQRPLLFLLDGFNEVGQSFQESCRLALERLMRKSFHLYVITSRPTLEAEQLTKQIKGIKVLDILQLYDEQMESFLASHGAAQIYEQMGNQLKGLVRNPFMLWALVQSCSNLSQGELPRNQGQLYQNFVDRYIFSEREASKVTPLTRYNYERVKRQILAQLAYQMTDQDKTRIVRDDELEECVINWLETIEAENRRRRRRIMPDDWSTEDFFDETVLNGVLRQFKNTLEFMHQSVQNYFVAVYLDSVSFDHEDFYKCLKHISWINIDNVWDEVITFFAGITSDLNRLIEQLIGQDLFLAASCAGSRSEDLTPDIVALLFKAIDGIDLETVDTPVKFYGSWWEKVIAAYKHALELVEDGSDKWAILHAKLGLAYTDRILEKTAENIETAIQHCQAALKVLTSETYPEKWADAQNNLGNAYRERIKGEWHKNFELATECYRLALTVRNLETSPIQWAVTQRNLGETYSKRIWGNRGENLEQAINCYQLALQVFTQQSFPQLWAQTYLGQGGVYCERVLGERAENLEQAINCYQLALQVFTQEDFPQRWAEAYSSLGNTYCDRIRGDRAENLEQAIEYYRWALQVFTQEAFPRRWAKCLNYLSNTYSERVRGDRAENIEQAIHSLMLTLEVFTVEDFPQQWSETLSRIGNAYRGRIRGGRAENIEQAINAYMQSLKVRTRDALPLQWSETIANLGNAYCERIRGDKAENIEQAIACYQQALTVRTREALPFQWAENIANLGNAYRERIRGDRAENIEQAIACYQQGLTVRTCYQLPLDWAETIANLGNAYWERIRGDRAENLEQAIACYQQALHVRTCNALPLHWAETMWKLGNAYHERIRGDRAENIEQAIAYYQQALTIRLHEALPLDWAATMMNLATAYSGRVRGERADNLEQSIQCYQQVLTVRTREALPLDWAETIANLGNAYQERIQGDKAENIEQAIACYQQALTVRTREALPLDWAETIANLGNAYQERIRGDRAENIEQAIAYYQQALTVRTREALPLDWAETMANLGNAYYMRLGGYYWENIEQAIGAYQLSLQIFHPEFFHDKCREIAGKLGNLYFDQKCWQEAVPLYQMALQAAEVLYRSANLLDSKAAELSKTADLPRRAAYAFARVGKLQQAVETLELGLARGLSESLDRDRADLTQLQQIYPDLHQDYQTIANQLRNLESQQRDRMTSDERHSLTPGALRDSAIALRQQLTDIIQRIRQFPGYEKFLSFPSFADFKKAVQSNCPLVYLVPTPGGSLALIVTSDTIHDLWLNALNETQLTDLLNHTWFAAYRQFHSNRQGWFDAIDTVTEQLWEPLMAPLIAHLQQHQFQQAILVPTGYLSFLPLHAAWTEDLSTPTTRRYALDDIHFTYAPNARSLTAAETIANRVTDCSILAIDNPTQDLPNSEREIRYAIASFPQHTVLRHTEATIETVRAQLSEAAVVHFSCHGIANLQVPLNSGLLMSDGLFTLRDILALNLTDHETGGIHIAILSACETGLPGIDLPDEAISLSTGLLQAGVAAVIASLWSVSDSSTMLLLSKFYELWRIENKEPSEALRQAQIWLRDSTAGDIANDRGLFTPILDDRPYTHPFHWAAFSYVGV